MEYEKIENLIRKEQVTSNGEFVSNIEIDAYIEKIRSRAELITHYIEGECAGFVAFYCNDPLKKSAFVTLVLVSERFRGQGISKNMLKCVLDVCKFREFKECSLEVRSDNYPAVKVYSDLGFIKVEENEGLTVMKVDLN